MTEVGILAILLGTLVGIWLTLRCRSFMYLWLSLLHLGAAFFYWNFTLTRVADAWGYYRVPAGDFQIGTMFVRVLVTFLKTDLGASYLDCFMVFQIAGYLGICLLYHLLKELVLTGNASTLTHVSVAASVMVPSLHVWTSAIGKDSIMFFGVMCFVWGAVHMQRRVLMMMLGVVVVFLVRPHVAASLVASFGLAVAFSKDVAPGTRVLVVATLSVALAASVPFVLDYVGLNAKGSDGLGDYIEQRQAANMEGGSSVDISQYPLPLQFLTYMYRPLFFDADSALALVVSCEHLVYLVTTCMLGTAGVKHVFSRDCSQFLRFNFIFWFATTVLFSATISNLGLAVRQKTGMLPSFFIFILATQRRKYPGRLDVPEPASLRAEPSIGAPQAIARASFR